MNLRRSLAAALAVTAAVLATAGFGQIPGCSTSGHFLKGDLQYVDPVIHVINQHTEIAGAFRIVAHYEPRTFAGYVDLQLHQKNGWKTKFEKVISWLDLPAAKHSKDYLVGPVPCDPGHWRMKAHYSGISHTGNHDDGTGYFPARTKNRNGIKLEC